MASPTLPYIIDGAVRIGVNGSILTVLGTIDDQGGATVDLNVGQATTVADGTTVTLKNISTGESLTVVTANDGSYAFNLQNLVSGYSEGQSYSITVTNITATSDLLERQHKEAKAYKDILVDKRGDEFTENYPFPVSIMNLIINNENPSSVYTYSGSNLVTETITIRGRRFQKNYTYSGSNLTNETQWTEL